MSDATTTPRSNVLYSAIVATVAASGSGRLTIREIARRVGTSEDVAAQCIALHRYLRAHAEGRGVTQAIPFPAPPDFTVPQADDEIDEVGLGLAVHGTS
jgi:hypothetical protein